MSAVRIAVVGDALLDVDLDGAVSRLCPDAPAPVLDARRETARPGGAALAAWMLACDGHDVTLVAAVGRDAEGDRLRRLVAHGGVRLVDIGAGGTTTTKTRMRADGRVLARVDRGGPPAVGVAAAELRRHLDAVDAVLVADYGAGVAAHPAVREALGAVRAPVVWDPHPRGPRPVPTAALVTPNRAEARGLAGGPDDGAAALRAALGVEAVAVTRGAEGVEVADGLGAPVHVAAPRVVDPAADTVGAGDRFAGAAAVALAGGASAAAAVEHAVRAATAFVEAGGVHALGPDAADPATRLVERVRARGGVVVATGGCFDLLHAGHVASLAAARAMGDCLVVLLNSDASVRRLKGPARPVVGQEDRAAVLRGLRSVDAVVVFDEDTPVAALRRLRPDVFAKGADHDPALLPEAAVMRAHGGRVAALPFVPGRSTSRLIEEVVNGR